MDTTYNVPRLTAAVHVTAHRGTPTVAEPDLFHRWEWHWPADLPATAAHDRNAEPEREPLDELVDVLCRVETSLDRRVIRSLTADVVQQRARQRRLAAELTEAPDVLSTGKPPAPIMVGKLLLALKRAGAEQLAAPVCGVCGRELRGLTFAGRMWGCSTCVSTPTLAACAE